MRSGVAVCIAALGAVLGACQSSSTESCSYNGATQLAATTWPKFRADGANSGRADVDLASSGGVPAVLLRGFCGSGTNVNMACLSNSDCPQPSPTPTAQTSPTIPSGSQTPTFTATPVTTPLGCVPVGPVVASPVLFNTTVYLASTDGTVYGVALDSMAPVTRFGVPGPISSTPLIGANGNVFVAGNGTLTQFFADGAINHQTSLSGIVSGSPNIWSSNGTTYIGTGGGEFAGVCPNGIPRYAIGFPSTQSSPAVVQDPHLAPGDLRPIAVGGGANGEVRAYDIKGRQYYAFTATNTIVASIVVDDLASPRVFYVADTNGQLFIVNLASGQSVNPGQSPTPKPNPNAPIFRAAYCDFPSMSPSQTCASDADCRKTNPSGRCIKTQIVASPALSRDETGKMYVADNTGVLWALDRATGKVLWNYPDTPPPPRRSITSSPAVAIAGANDIVVFAVDFFDDTVNRMRSRMVALIDNDTGPPTPLWHSTDGLEGVSVCGTVGTTNTALASSPSIGPDGTVYIGLSSVGDPGAPDCPDLDSSIKGGGLAAIMP